MAQPRKIAVGAKGENFDQFQEMPPDFGIPLDLTSVDLAKYALRIESVFVVDLSQGDDFNAFDAVQDQFIDFALDSSLLARAFSFGYPKGFDSSNYKLIQLKDYQSADENRGKGNPPAEAEFIYTKQDKETGEISFPAEQWRRVVNYALTLTGSTTFSGFFGLIIECVPFETRRISFGKNNEGQITAVEDIIDFATSTMAKSYIDALCGRVSMPTPPKIVLLSESFMIKYAAHSTLFQLGPGNPSILGSTFFIVDQHMLGHKIGKGVSEPVCNLADQNSADLISSDDTYLAELALHFDEIGRQSMSKLYYGAGVPTGGTLSGGYFVMILNDKSTFGLLSDTLLHEIGHCLTPGDILNPSVFRPHLNIKADTHNSSFADTKQVYKNWRGFGSGKISSFDSHESEKIGHPSPAGINPQLHSCALIYILDNEMCPMPSSNLMGYPNTQTLTAGSIYYEASYLGASCDTTEFPTQGEVFLHEAFVSLVNEFAEETGDYRRISSDEEGFLMFDPNRFNNNLALAKTTLSFFLKLQILWGGIQPRNSFLGLLPNDHIISFTFRPEDPSNRYTALRKLFYVEKIKYDKFEFTQEQEYKLPYQDLESFAFSSNGADFLKRHSGYSDIQHEETDMNDGPNTAHSHVHNKILDLMEFEILEDVIEVINGQPRRTYSGIAKYNYIISKAKEDTESALASAFTLDEADAKIQSIFGGEKVAKQMVLKNEAGEEECKYVYIVARPASNLDFENVSLEDDKGRFIGI